VFVSLGAARAFAKKDTPVDKIVSLLEDLHTKIEADGEKEQKMYDKFACWCETTTQRKSTAIEDAADELRRLGQMILAKKGRVAVRTDEISELEHDIEASEKAMAKATSMRQSENKEWAAATAEIKEAMAALELAIKVLNDNAIHAVQSEFLQTSATMKQHAIMRATSAMQGLPASATASAAFSPKKVSQVQQYAKALGKSNAQYSGQAATIMGILGDMYVTFAKDVEEETNEEGNKNRDYEDFMATKQKEYNEMKEVLTQKKQEKNEAAVMLTEATEAYDDTKEQMKADTEFFDSTKKTCEENTEAWQARKSSREIELEGIDKALDILTSPDAKKQFGDAFESASFLQVEVSSSAPEVRAYDMLKRTATSSHSLRLAKLAAKVRVAKSGHFDKVIGAIDEVIESLKDEEKSDIKQRDKCKDQYQEHDVAVQELDWKIEKNEAKIDKLETLIDEKTTEREKTIEQIEDVTKEIEEMEDTRKDENKEFKQAKKDDEAAIKLLKKAKDALAEYYEKNAKFIQETKAPEFEKSEDHAPEFKLASKSKRKNQASGVVGLFELLIEDLETDIKNGEKAEENAQEEFEENLKAAKKLKKELRKKKSDLKEQIADHEEDKNDEHSAKDDNEQDKSEEEDFKAEIEPDCDWILEHFDQRDQKRESEMNGLVQAKEYLMGAVPSMLQGAKPHFDDEQLSKINFGHMSF
jgi:chromosome segregation ATPase